MRPSPVFFLIVSLCFRLGHRCFPAQARGARDQVCVGGGVSHTLGLNSSWQLVCEGIHARPRDATEGQPTNHWTHRTEGLPQTCHCFTGHRGLKPTTEEPSGFRAPHRWECLAVEGDALRGLSSPQPLCGPPTHRVAALEACRQCLEELLPACHTLHLESNCHS